MLQGLEKKDISNDEFLKIMNVKNIYILPKGLKIINQINQIFEASESKLIGALTEKEQAEFLRLLEKIDNNL